MFQVTAPPGLASLHLPQTSPHHSQTWHRLAGDKGSRLTTDADPKPRHEKITVLLPHALAQQFPSLADVA